jgi:hypothetical protein
MLFNDRKVAHALEADVQKDASTTNYILLYTRR